MSCSPCFHVLICAYRLFENYYYTVAAIQCTSQEALTALCLWNFEVLRGNVFISVTTNKTFVYEAKLK